MEAEEEFSSIIEWLKAHPEALNDPQAVVDQIYAVSHQSDVEEIAQIVWSILPELVEMTTPTQVSAILLELRERNFDVWNWIFSTGIEQKFEMTKKMFVAVAVADSDAAADLLFHLQEVDFSKVIALAKELTPKIAGKVLYVLDEYSYGSASPILMDMTPDMVAEILGSMTPKEAAFIIDRGGFVFLEKLLKAVAQKDASLLDQILAELPPETVAKIDMPFVKGK
ncbi:MAG: hypothetical protein H0T78_06535 [Longispora sp.]|nr:hypothetical protein [Longispora sp. (in: high G+C Gram-positive bacteria)]